MKEKDIKQTICHGQALHTPYVRIHIYLPPNPSPQVQFACVVSKKISPSAVRRHKYQRWLREIIRPLTADFPAGTNLVLIAKPAIGQLSSISPLKDSLVASLNSQSQSSI
ncbi:MAG: hypothetical protein A3G57_01950 [Candidatus Andersenbacteria bacterium RIFCSPLOWO2_12_FULL_45_8]|nr:MAG: hypothetical protein A3B76_03545 [Candidatus Andersenbacteria bacterium RIFCSPHIGHO2_02_FULL_46_16]OGY37491.1 MAG: hypothetical protein A3I08_00465 [Candidatus Andersenbacteria bacterium RIFCSPLOWO2_02_FULL_46_11]OGY42280.1 MAG: hypothetical protein A3G57_01950 [Candidatus Andersenbacteria bacterium RIFCSPLOWO2_12_FULL_45_8]HBE90164.1 hypothetical protein [Candidatus Andersenbacteria bacterium]